MLAVTSAQVAVLTFLLANVGIASGCGGSVTDPIGKISSPNFPNSYENNLKCTWHITAPDDQVVHLTFVSFDVKLSIDCGIDVVAVFNGSSDLSPKLTPTYGLCGPAVPQADYISGGPDMVVTFNTAATTRVAKGFKAIYVFRDKANVPTDPAPIPGCGGALNEAPGEVMSPNFPDHYDFAQNCSWHIQAPEGKFVNLVFTYLSLENHPRCRFDFVKVLDGPSNSLVHLTPLGGLCGFQGPKARLVYVSTGSKLTILMRSDINRAENGFKATFEFLDRPPPPLSHPTLPAPTLLPEVKCGGSMTDSTAAVFTTPGHPSVYPSFSNCYWYIHAPEGQLIQLTFTGFSVERGRRCSWDVVMVLDGPNDSSQQLTPEDIGLCDVDLPTPNVYRSSQPNLLVIFKSDGDTSYAGFRATFVFIDPSIISSIPPDNCGGTFTASSGQITTPNYPAHYYNNDRCFWNISAPVGSLVQLKFTNFDVGNSPNCDGDAVKVFDGDSTLSRRLTSENGLCGDNVPTQIFTSTGQDLLVFFESDAQWVYNGFRATYVFKSCVGNFTAPTGEITSLNYPNPYNNYADCSWLIEAPEGETIQLKFTDFDVEPTTNCYCDKVEVFDGNSVTSAKLSSQHGLCGNADSQAIVLDYQSTGSHLLVTFVSDSSVATTGFRAVYKFTGRDVCGDTFTNATGEIASPNHPDEYDNLLNCVWMIRAPPGQIVELKILSFSVEVEENCALDALKILDGNLTSSPGLTPEFGLCGDRLPAQTVYTSTGPHLLVSFKTDNSGSDIGFKAAYRFLGCPDATDYTGRDGTIRSPYYPKPYLPNTSCTFNIQVSEGEIAAIRFDHLELEGREEGICKYDFLKIYDPTDGNSLLTTVCGDGNQDQDALVITASGNAMTLVFVSDDTKVFPGFKLRYFEQERNPTSCRESFEHETFGIIASNRPSETYANNLHCVWDITLEPGLQIVLTFHEFEFEKCGKYDFLDVYEVEPSGNRRFGQRFCGKTLPENYMSTSNQLQLVMRTDRSVRKRGFQLRYSGVDPNPSADCSSVLTEETGAIDYPGSGTDYSPLKRCEWVIMVQPGMHLQLNITDFSLEDEVQCSHDYLEIRNGKSLGSPLLVERLCGNRTNIPILDSHFHVVYIRFQSNNSTESSGFRLEYKALPGCGANVTDVYGYIQSPVYPEGFPANLTCEWNLDYPLGQNVIIRPLDLDFGHGPNYSSNTCAATDTFVEIVTTFTSRGLVDTTREQLCQGPLKVFNTDQRQATVAFSSNSEPSGRGFVFQYDVECNETISLINGTVTSPNFPKAYKKDAQCVFEMVDWTWYTYYGPITTVFIEHLYTPDCENKLFKIDSSRKTFGPSCPQSPYSGKFVIYNDTDFKLRYSSDSTNPGEGFRVSWTRTDCDYTLEETSGVFTSLDFPSYAPLYSKCRWTVNSKFGYLTTLSFTEAVVTVCSRAPVLVNGAPLCSNQTEFTLATNKVEVTASVPDISTPVLFSASYNINCGGVWEVERYESQYLASQDFDNLRTYKSPDHCMWTIRPKEQGMHVYFKLTAFGIEESPECKNGSLTIESSEDRFSEITLCGQWSDLPIWRSTTVISGEEVNVTFSVNEGSVGIGFEASVYLEQPSCDGVFTSPEGAFTSPNYPNRYPNQKSCDWWIIAPRGYEVQLNFTDFNLDGDHPFCFGDYVKIEEVHPDSSAIVHTFPTLCEAEIEDTLVFKTTSNRVHISFFSDNRGRFKGFQAVYKYEVPVCDGFYSEESREINLASTIDNPFVCEWNIEVAEGSAIQLEVTDYDNSFVGKCDKGLKVTGIQPPGSDVTPLTPSCNNFDYPRTVVCPGNKVTVSFDNMNSPNRRLNITFNEIIVSSICGGQFTGPAGVISTPWQPGVCAASQQRGYLIICDPKRKVKLDMLSLGGGQGCQQQLLTIYDGANAASRVLDTMCSLPDVPLYSSSNQVFITPLTSSASFTVAYSEVCRETTTALEGTIRSPNYPSPDFGSTILCTWIIRLPWGHHVSLDFDEIALAPSNSAGCDNADVLQISSQSPAPQSVKTLQLKLCPQDLISEDLGMVNISENHIILELQPSASTTAPPRGFKITYKASCSRDLDAETSWADIHGSHSELPGECSWTIWAQNNSVVEIDFTNLNLPASEACASDYVELQDWETSSRFCGDSLPPSTYLSHGRRLKVVYHWETVVAQPYLYPATFNLSYRSVDGPEEVPECGRKFTTPVGSLVSKNFPDRYIDFLHCEWTIIAPEDHVIHVSIDAFEMEVHPTCYWDELALHDVEIGDTKFASLCGDKDDIKDHYQTFGKELKIVFSTDISIKKTGFSARFYTVKKCQKTLSGPSGIIEVASDTKCSWSLTAPEDHEVRLDTSDFGNPVYGDCFRYYGLQVYNGHTDTADKLTPSCHSQLFPNFVLTSSNEVLITFLPIDDADYTSFNITYSAEPFDSVCGGSFNEESGVFSSAPLGTVCSNPGWFITVPEDYNVIITFMVFSYNGARDTSNIPVIYDGPDASSAPLDTQLVLDTAVTNYHPETMIEWTSTTNQLFLAQTGGIQDVSFIVLFNSSCLRTITDRSGMISSSNYPGNYPNDHRCAWRLSAPRDLVLKLNFEHFELNSTNCFQSLTTDRVELQVKNSFSYLFCGGNAPRPAWTYSGNAMTITFQTDSTGVDTGFTASFYSTCGPATTHSGGKGTIGFPSAPRLYQTDLNCSWKIPKIKNARMGVMFTRMNLPGSAGSCAGDYVEVGKSDVKYCGDSLPDLIWLNSSSTIRFVSDAVDDEDFTGFALSYFPVTDSCFETLETQTGEITSPKYPNRYTAGLYCYWFVKATEGQFVQLTINSFNVESARGCSYDKVMILDGPDFDSPSLTGVDGLCGGTLPNVVVYNSSGPNLGVHFQTDQTGQYRGFKATYTILDAQ